LQVADIPATAVGPSYPIGLCLYPLGFVGTPSRR